MKRFLCVMSMLLLMVVILYGCENKDKHDVILEQGKYKIYTINNNQTGIEWAVYEAKSEDTKNLVEELLVQLSTDPTNFSSKHAINDNVIVKEITLSEGTLLINFDSAYQNQKSVDEVLLRAAIVKTLTQIDEVEYVEFSVNQVALIDAYDKTIGQMASDDFIDDNDIENSKVPAVLSLYFANEAGDKLVECTVSDLYDGSITMEQMVLLQLIKGPKEYEMEEGLQSAIPSNTVLNNVTTKEGVCYVDFSKEFLTPVEGVNEEVSIYAVVNSLVELSNINKVQIMIDGKIVENYRDNMELDIIYERNLDIVEGTK